MFSQMLSWKPGSLLHHVSVSETYWTVTAVSFFSCFCRSKRKLASRVSCSRYSLVHFPRGFYPSDLDRQPLLQPQRGLTQAQGRTHSSCTEDQVITHMILWPLCVFEQSQTKGWTCHIQYTVTMQAEKINKSTYIIIMYY